MLEYLNERVTDLAYENAILRLRVKDLIDIIEGFQRFGTIGRFDEDRIAAAKRDHAEIVAKHDRRQAELSEGEAV